MLGHLSLRTYFSGNRGPGALSVDKIDFTAFEKLSYIFSHKRTFTVVL